MVSQRSQKFNEHLAKSSELQVKLRSITSPAALIDMARGEGFQLDGEDVRGLAQEAYRQWLSALSSQARLFFELVHLTPELNEKLHQCNSGGDVIDLANECGFEITSSELKLAAGAAASIQGFSFEKLFFQHLGMIES